MRDSAMVVRGVGLLGLALTCGGVFVYFSLPFAIFLRTVGVALVLYFALKANPGVTRKRASLEILGISVVGVLLFAYAGMTVLAPVYRSFVLENTSYLMPVVPMGTYVVASMGSVVGLVLGIYAFKVNSPLRVLGAASCVASMGVWANGYLGLFMLLVGAVLVLASIVRDVSFTRVQRTQESISVPA
ncbi:MAG: hypothetical protein Q4G30_09065 [Actinomycetaceae bacterium]|nr:hypothetical protein [Actinomycetaceae bacterium]